MVTVQDRVHELLAPIVATLDVELIDVEFTGGTLRVTVDDGSSDGGVTTQALAEVNRLISPILDQHDPVPGRYTLEVSSPGLERPLKRPGHYRRAIGEQIVVKLAASSDPRRVKGRLVSVSDAEHADGEQDIGPVDIVIEASEIDGVPLDEPEDRHVSTADVATARTVFDWGPSPKPGKSKKASNRKSGNQKNSNQKSRNQQSGSQKSPKKSTSTTSSPDQPTGSSKQGTSQEEVRDEQ